MTIFQGQGQAAGKLSPSGGKYIQKEEIFPFHLSQKKKNIGDCEKAEGERERGMNNEWSTSTCQTIRFRSF